VLRDERGIVMVLALPLAAVLVFALWHVARVGDAILEHERVQDAADAVAFESATLHARGMNALALLASMEEAQPALVRELAPRVAAVVPVLATVAAVDDNTLFYERTLMTASHALLPNVIDAQLVRDERRPWAFARGVSAPRLGGASSLPVQHLDRLRMWPQAENGNVMLQVWGWAEAHAGQPAVAQAEYYFACHSDWNECEPLRALNWTARMRRAWSPAVTLHNLKDAIAHADDQLRPLLPHAPTLAVIFNLFAGETPRWMH
jgi:hypothetical protein